MSLSNGHPLPPPPGQQQQARPAGRDRSKSSFSFKSNHSHKSSGSTGKIDLTETHAEKESKRLQSKADPTMAIQEAEPAVLAATESTSLSPIRAIQHLDKQGRPIADPDRSNPTRSRWERPLDTIRAFEAAIDGNYSRKPFHPNGSTSSVNMSRRSSYFGGESQNGMTRSHSYRPESFVEGRGNGPSRPDSYYYGNESAGNAGPSNGYYPNRARYPRTASEPHFAAGHGVYPPHGNPQSYETVTTASGSGGSGDPAGYMTDPSSENSSIDRIAPAPPMDQYGYEGPGQPSSYHPQGNGYRDPAMSRQAGGYHTGPGAPAPPPKGVPAGTRVPIKLGSSTAPTGPQTYVPPAPVPERRKSWFGKRFSRNA